MSLLPKDRPGESNKIQCSKCKVQSTFYRQLPLQRFNVFYLPFEKHKIVNKGKMHSRIIYMHFLLIISNVFWELLCSRFSEFFVLLTITLKQKLDFSESGFPLHISNVKEKMLSLHKELYPPFKWKLKETSSFQVNLWRHRPVSCCQTHLVHITGCPAQDLDFPSRSLMHGHH